jgi:hypothetical protein
MPRPCPAPANPTPANPAPTKKTKKTLHRQSLKLARSGALSNQHGAWAMVFGPALSAVIIFGVSILSVWVLLEWVIAYCCLFSWAGWAASGFKKRFRTSALAYAGILVATGVGLVVMRPQLFAWIPLFCVLCALYLGLAAAKKTMSLPAQAIATLTAALIPLVIASLVGMPASAYALATIWLVQEFGSVLHVRSMMRPRNRGAYTIASLLWHGIATLASIVGVAALMTGAVTNLGIDTGAAPVLWLLPVLTGLLFIKAAALTTVRSQRKVPVMVVGIIEGFSVTATFVMCLIIFLSLPA